MDRLTQRETLFAFGTAIRPLQININRLFLCLPRKRRLSNNRERSFAVLSVQSDLL